MDWTRRYRRVWKLGIGVGIALACMIAIRLSSRPNHTASVTGEHAIESESDMIYQRREPVGWVFGRVVGFKGADKPLLPPQTLPVP